MRSARWRERLIRRLAGKRSVIINVDIVPQEDGSTGILVTPDSYIANVHTKGGNWFIDSSTGIQLRKRK